MKKYMMVRQETLLKLTDCFTSEEELQTFMAHLLDLNEEINFTALLIKRSDDDSVVSLMLKQLCVVTIFFREHIDLIHEMIKSLEYSTLTEDELNELKE